MNGAALSARGPVLSGLAALALFLGGFGLWSVAARIEGAVVAPGRIEAALAPQAVTHPEGGTVAEVRVREGQRVAAGTLLVRLDPTLLAAELSVVEAALQTGAARQLRLEAERDGATALAFPPEPSEHLAVQAGEARLFALHLQTQAADNGRLRQRIAQSRAEIDAIDAELAGVTRQRALIAGERPQVEALTARGLAPAARLLDMQREEARLDSAAGALAARRASAEDRVAELEFELAQLPAARRAEAESELHALAERQAELAGRRRILRERIARLDLVAPVSGTVLALRVTAPGSVLRPFDPVLTLVPEVQAPLATVEVPPAAAEDLHPGQAVRLVLDRSPDGTATELRGRVRIISAAPLSDPQGRQLYRAEVGLDPGEAARLGGRALPAGLPLTAYFATGPRRPLDLLTAPFTMWFARAFREG